MGNQQKKAPLGERCLSIFGLTFFIGSILIFSFGFTLFFSIFVGFIIGVSSLTIWLVLKTGKRVVVNTLTPPKPRQVNKNS